ncbi:DNA mismatch repair protein MutS2 [Thermolongibacillus altinsuensis]|uniref:Endonuclease MutS2 n=1 Tax=Thermolongibacillus altinsuensis TaxID=575256 RepID=A0A4V2QAG6_9BACL|nr:endonuclease MutS2 [Thermolongibacillus altinsuensis]TCL51865.1 DNA mismatch repair protein MutS2 [Thermolongibacillus altinsuensis]GMB07399.1 endonuclease MutS2 [Thermolongibacillus altinsuensis]
MHPRTLTILEFDKVKAQLMEHVASSLGKEKVEKLVPSTDFAEVVRWQEETDEAATVLRLRGHVPLGGIFDIRASVKRAKIGGTLSPHELLDVASTIYASRQMKKFIESLLDDVALPHLAPYVERMIALPELEQAINHCIDDHGEIMDQASERLRSLRQQLRATEGRIRDKLESIIRSSSAQKMLSDAIITIRNERYVIPVKQEYRHAYGGIVHDQSSSGATLFIEPQSVVDLNNQLQELRVKEKQEMERILVELTKKVAEDAEAILVDVDMLAELDFIFAKAKYAKQIKATKPDMNDRGYIRLLQARHPLISPDEVVPNDIELGKDYTAIVITGPNTGGKTVTLKTIGLFTLMAQAGLQIPALDGSELAVFRAVYADIGDEQSIEQSLSTFSSHMVNIVDILKKVDEHSLVLFDELGAGTDPQEGAALAIAILDEVHQRGARVVATTHYPELKAYGYNRQGVINASVEFDIETLSPTYKLLIGIPGRSNALEISRRLGLDEQIIERARTYISAESNQVENMIASLEYSKKRAEEEFKEAEDFRKEAEKLHKELQKQIIELNEQRDRWLEEAKKKAESIVKKAQQEAEQIIRELRQMKKEQLANIKEHELIEAKKRLEEAIPHIEIKRKEKKQKKPEQTLHPGDEVKVVNLNQKGQLLEKVSDDEWLVQIGILKMKVKEENLEYVSRPKPIETKPLATVKGKDYHVPLELDLRGERYEDALLRLEKYIDDALLAGYPRVSIIHGKGTGALRKGVQQYLQNHRSVKSFRFGEATEGGTGVTIVELK